MENKKIVLVIAETMGTDGEYSSEVYPCHTTEEGRELAHSLIGDMKETMDWENIANNYSKISGGDEYDSLIVRFEIGTWDWWYRVRVEEREFVKL
jgi:hypothetical protein